MASGAFEQPDRVSELVVREPIDNTRARWINRARSADHKVVGTTLIGFSLMAVVLAGFTELMTLGQLAVQDNDFLTPERFYALHTLSDTTYLYLFALPLFAGLATYVLPLQIGARSSAFPRFSALGAWMVVFGGVTLYFSTFLNAWQGTVQVSSPLSTYFFTPAPGVDFWFVAAIMVAGGLLANAIDLAVTYKNSRADGMSADRTPVFAYSAAVYAYGVIATAPVLIAACLMALIERQWQLFGIFDPVSGGSAMLWKTLFQWFSHSAPYLILILAIGAVSEIFAAAAGRSVANSAGLKKAIRLFAILGILSFGQVYFGSPVAEGWLLIFMVIGLSLLIPSFMIFSSWLQTIGGGNYRSTVPAMFSMVFVVIFAFIVIDHVAYSLPALSQWLEGSQFGYASWLTKVWGTAAFAGFGALLFWFPKITGRNFEPGKAKVALGMIAIGTIVATFAMASLGVDGFARELSTYSYGYQGRNMIAGLATLLAAFGVIGLLINFMQSAKNGGKAGNDPWGAGTLEWFVPSPPPVNNFDSVPTVTSESPLNDLRSRIASETGEFAGSVAQSPTAGRPSLRGSKH